MKAIIIAAGISSRLRPFTNDMPKCMLDVGGKTILEIIIDSFISNNINDISIIRGYKKEVINVPGAKYYENVDFQNNNILESLFSAEEEMNGEFMFTYSDIIYTKEVVKKLLKTKADIAIIVDTDWKKRYEGRTLHPVSEAELVLSEGGYVKKIGKGIEPENAHGEFIGLGMCSDRGAHILKDIYNEVKVQFKEKQFHHAISIKKAYLTDMIQELVDRGIKIKIVDISGGWLEIDTLQDFERALAMWGSQNE